MILIIHILCLLSGVIIGVLYSHLKNRRPVQKAKEHIQIVACEENGRTTWAAWLFDKSNNNWWNPYSAHNPHAPTPGNALVELLNKAFQTQRLDMLIEYTITKPNKTTMAWWKLQKKELRSPHSGFDPIDHYLSVQDGGHVNEENHRKIAQIVSNIEKQQNSVRMAV